MSRRFLSCAAFAAVLSALACAFWLPAEVGPRLAAQADPEPPTTESKLIAREAGIVFSFAVSDLLADELLELAFRDVVRNIADSVRVPLADVQRLTLAYVEGGWVRFVQTRQPYDKEAMKKAMTRPRFGGPDFRVKDKDKDGRPERPRDEAKEMKVGNRTVHYVGEWGRWTEGFVALDARTFAVGEVIALRKVFKAEGESSPEMALALSSAGKHSAVMALDGKRLMAIATTEMTQDRRRFEEERRRFDGEKAKPDEKKEEKAEKADPEDEFFSNEIGVLLTPYKPLVRSKSAVVTLDAKKSYTLAARVTVADKGDLDDAETSLRSLLYTAREMAVSMPKMERGEMRGYRPLSAPIHQAFKAAKVERKDLTLTATVTLTPEAGLTKKLAAGLAEERKRREEMTKDRPRFDKEKGGFPPPPPPKDGDFEKKK